MLASDIFESNQVPTFVVLCYVRMQNTDVCVQEEVPELDGSGRLRPHSCLLHVARIHRHIRLQGNQRPLHAQLSGGIPSVLRIRGCLSRIRICIKEFQYF
jgi:hypothetical protein